MSNSIGVIGAGHMGSAMITGWLKSGFKNINVLDKNTTSLDVNHYSISDYKSFFYDSGIIFVVVRPSQWPDIMDLIPKEKIKVSVMAGINTTQLGGGDWVRVMPNLSVQNCNGTIGYFSKNEYQTVKIMLKKLGLLVELDSEDMLHSFTALSGSGPAWFWCFMAEWLNVAESMGYSRDLALKIVKNTIAGSLAMTDSDPKILYESVASKGGTTEAGLKVLHGGGRLVEAINAAFIRSKELEQE